jgi:hypothetical protein
LDIHTEYIVESCDVERFVSELGEIEGRNGGGALDRGDMGARSDDAG